MPASGVQGCKPIPSDTFSCLRNKGRISMMGEWYLVHFLLCNDHCAKGEGGELHIKGKRNS